MSADDEYGVVKFFRADLGYGFIYSDHGGNDIYLHRKQILPGTNLESGSRVKYELKHGAVNDKLWAKNVRSV